MEHEKGTREENSSSTLTLPSEQRRQKNFFLTLAKMTYLTSCLWLQTLSRAETGIETCFSFSGQDLRTGPILQLYSFTSSRSRCILLIE